MYEREREASRKQENSKISKKSFKQQGQILNLCRKVIYFGQITKSSVNKARLEQLHFSFFYISLFLKKYNLTMQIT